MADFTLSVPDSVLGVQPAASDVAPQAQEPEFETINVGHASFEIQKGASPEARQAAIKNFMQTPEFYAGIDKKTGAPWDVRKAVGSSLKPEDRLATLRKFYPDATAYEDDNFLFTDPKSGRVTLYNPKGLDWGDVPSVFRETAIGVGSSLGAVAGGVSSLATGPAAPLTAPQMSAVGAGLGAATAATVYDYLSQKFGGTVRSEGIIQRTGELVTEAAGAAAGQAIGEVAVPAIMSSARQMLGGGTSKAAAIYNKMQEFGITPTAGAVTGGKGAGRIEGALDQAAASATVMRDQIEEVMGQAQKAAEDLAAKVGRPMTQQGVGVRMQEAAQNAVERFAQQQKVLEDGLATKIGEDAPFAIDNIVGLRDELMQFGGNVPRFFKTAYGDVMEKLNMLIADAGQSGGAIPYSTFRQIRSYFGEKMSDMGEGVNRTLYKRMYAAMSEDLVAGAEARGAKDMFDETVGFTKAFKQEYSDFLNKVIDYEAPEKGYRFLMNSARDGGTYFLKLKDQFTKDEWKDVSATIIQKLGMKNFGNEADDAFSISTFLTNYEKNLSKEAKDALFDGLADGKALRPELDGLVDVFKEMQKSARMRNFSNTAGAAHTLGIMSSLGGDVTKLLLGSAAIGGYSPGMAAAGAAGTLVGGIIAPRYASKLITNPGFVRWLAEAPTVKTGAEVGAHIGRLGAVYEANPEIRDAINALVYNMRQPEQGTPQ